MTDYPDQKTLDSIYGSFDPTEEGWTLLKSVWEKCREAGRAEVQKRIDESPVVTCHTDDLGSHVVFVGDAPGPWHLVPVEWKDD